ncbi:Dabb family protein [Methylocaldum marinum]|uniref:Dabb family protein n=1 Tax=Methylocaldum marinum TaxID=1432792 RepID=UPI001E4D4F7A|nr:Dabb family protein [Methylocaldum marinum]
MTFLIFSLMFTAVSSAEPVPPTAGRVHHVVIVWLKEHGNPEARRQYIEATQSLSKLPMLLSYQVGTVLPGKRDVVDSSYDVAIVATFENAQALDEYSRHPDHDKVIDEKLKQLVDKVLVYDFVEAP